MIIKKCTNNYMELKISRIEIWTGDDDQIDNLISELEEIIDNLRTYYSKERKAREESK